MTNMEASQSCGDWAKQSPCSACARKDELLRRAREYVAKSPNTFRSAIHRSNQASLLAEIDKELEVKG